jgi:hypothetical protein
MPAAAGWRSFAARRYRPFHGIAVGQAFVGGLASNAIFVPFLLALDANPAAVMVVGTLPMLGTALQAALPRLLRWTDGNLRGLTLLATLAELRGFALAAVAAGVALGLLAAGPAILAVAVIVGAGQTLGIISGSNIAVWTRAVLSEEERRLVGPRGSALASGLGTLMLLPAAALLDGAIGARALWIYAALFLVSGVASLLIPWYVLRLRDPGRVRVPDGQTAGAEAPPAFDRFLRNCLISSFGQGVLPYFSVFAISVLGLSAGYAVLLSAVGSAASLAANVAVSSFLEDGSSSRLLRLSYIARVVAAGLAIAAMPGLAIAPVLLLVACALFNAGGSASLLAAQERLFRLVSPGAAITCHARYVSGTSLAATAGAAVSTGVLALAGPAAYPVHAALFAVSGLTRAVAAWRIEVGPSWRSRPAAQPGPEVAAQA